MRPFVFTGLTLVLVSGSASAQPYDQTVVVSTVSHLEHAVLNTVASTEILISDGTYNLSRTLILDGVWNIAIRSQSGDRDAVVIAGEGMGQSGGVPFGFLIQNVQDVLIADLTLRDFRNHSVIIQGEQGAQRPTLRNLRSVDVGEQHIKVTVGSNGLHCDGGVVEDCLIEYTTTARDDYTNGIDVLAGHGWTVRDCVLRNIRSPDDRLAGPAILFWRGAQDTVIERNRLFNCQRGIALGLLDAPGNDHVGGIVRNNFIHRAADEPGDVGIAVADCPGYQICHNTVILHDTFAWALECRFADSNGEMQYNLSDGPIFQRDDAQGTLVGNLTSVQSDWFVDMATGDFHLTADATAALDAASPLAVVTDDIDREPRGAMPDVGADEREAGGSAEASALLLR